MSGENSSARDSGGASGADRGASTELGPELEWRPNYPLIRRIDAIWYAFERLVCGVMFLTMALLVFAAVVSDVFGTRREWSDLLVLYVFAYLGVRTREVRFELGEEKPGPWVSLAIAAAITAGVAGAVVLYVERYPGGFVFAQKLALVMMLWVALLGASMATYERTHLALEMGEMLWPRPLLHLVKALAHAVTSAFCLALFVLSMQMVFHDHSSDERILGLIWMPLWVAVLIMPYAFADIAIRMLAQSFTRATRGERPMDEQIPT